MAATGEVQGGPQSLHRGAWFHRVAGTQEGLELGPGNHTPGWEGLWLLLRMERGSITESSCSRPHFWSLGRAVKGLGAHLPPVKVHSPDSTILPPEDVGRALGELVQVPAVLPCREECAQLCIHVTEDEGQLGQLSPAGKSYEHHAGCRKSPYRCKASRFPQTNQGTKSRSQF